MTYTFRKQLVSSGKYYCKCPKTRTPKFVVVHNTANKASAKNEINYMVGNDNYVSYHVAVDDVEAVQAIEFNRSCFACGDGANGQGNVYGISVEICYSTKYDGNEYTNAEENAVYVCARLLHQHGLGIDALKQHADFANKNCPHRIRESKSWDGFKGRVQWVLDEIKKGTIKAELSSGTTSQTVTTTSTTNEKFKIGDYGKTVKTTDNLNIRAKRNATSSIKGTIPKGETVTVEYILYQDDSKTPNGALWGSVYTKYGDGFINLNYVEPVVAVATATNTFKSYTVKVTADVLNVRKSSTVNSAITTTIKKNEVYTIVEEKSGWGKLKSGKGWINLSYTAKC